MGTGMAVAMMQPATSTHLSPTLLRVLWLLIMAYLVLNAAFLLALAVGYFTFLDSTSLFNFLAYNFLFSRSQRFLSRHHRLIGAAYSVLSLPFLDAAGRLAWHSLRRRQLAFGPGIRRQGNSARAEKVTTAWGGGATASVPHVDQAQMMPIPVFTPRTVQIRRNISALYGSVGIDGAHFTAFILVSETVELLLQTIQGYRSSKYISNTHINQLYGAMIFLNCWSSPVIHYVWETRRHQVTTARLLTLLVDTLLDFAWGTVLQGCLLARYWAFFRDGQWPNAVPELYDRELRQLLVVSTSNFVFSVFPFVTSGLVVREICMVLDREGTVTSAAKSANVNKNPKVGTIVHRFDSNTSRHAPDQVDLEQVATQRTLQAVVKRNYLTVHFISLMVFGVLILITSIGSSGLLWPLKDSDVPCLNQLYPWFTSTVSCVGRRVSCANLHIAGTEQEMAAVLARVSPFLLSNLIIVDCPALVMPSAIHRFSQLVTLGVANTTVVQWDEAAAVTDP